MKRERPRDNNSFVPPVLPFSERSAIEPRKVFVFKGEKRLASRNGPAKTVQRILIFDNHPDTLHLLFSRAGAWADPEAEESTRWWEPVLGWMLAGGVLVLVLVMLFLKLRS